MYFFFHLLTGFILGFLLTEFLHDLRWLLPCAAGAALPDLIDKPIGLLFFASLIGYGRIYSHTFLVSLLVLIVGLAIWNIQKDPGVIAVGVGIVSHQILDLMWLEPVNWYYPLLGTFEGTIINEDIILLLGRELVNPFEWILAFIVCIGFIAIICRNKILAGVRRNIPIIRFTAAVCALLLCILSGILIGGGGIAGQVLIEIGWNRSEELIIGGIVTSLAAYLVWHWQSMISRS
jgi:membrane-bound metal-dependent hydrolase YbcI (DUF457 family)